MYQSHNTAPITSLPGIVFTQTRVLTYGQGIIVTHHWLDTRDGVDAGGFATKAEAVASARRYRAAVRAERA